MLLVQMLPTPKFSQQQTMLQEGRKVEGEKSGSRHQAACCDSAPAGAVAWGLKLPGTSLTDTTSSVCAGTQLPGSAHLQPASCVDRRGRDQQKCSFYWVQVSRELPWWKGSSTGNLQPELPLLPEQNKGVGLGHRACVHVHTKCFESRNNLYQVTPFDSSSGGDRFNIKLSTLLTYRKQAASDSRFRNLNLAVSIQAMKI